MRKIGSVEGHQYITAMYDLTLVDLPGNYFPRNTKGKRGLHACCDDSGIYRGRRGRAAGNNHKDGTRSRARI
ncbi:hypothetical protein AAJCM20276_03700 [Acetobacter aceti]|uniref:Uncharacterized protein n=1 Tax=Acetobacter aceti TaxID=435 RepID=A0A6S6PFJ8_ACEAC|nr:hypothetical protein AAJCM20276_03700 [Acetobacter aceti]